jgi:epsilon-lactone hydrolase
MVDAKSWPMGNAPPAPRSISEEARAILDAPSEFSGARPPGKGKTKEEWIAWSEAMDQVLVESYAARIPNDLPLEQSRFEIDGVTTYVFRPEGVPESPDTPLFISVHGGALITGGGEACRLGAIRGALEREMITWATDYRLAPRHPYPEGLDDLVAAYRKAVSERDPRDIIVAGGSAGGNLAAALLVRAKDEGLPMPAALMLMTPEVDLTESGDSFRTLLGIDKNQGRAMAANLLYADGADLAHPHLSPLFADLTGFPPTYLQSGTRDIFLSNTVLMHRALRAAGVDAELHIGEAMPHGGFGGSTPEDLALAEEARGFIVRHLRPG